MPWSLPSYVRAPARLGPKMPGSWSGCCRISGATGLTPLFWSAAIVILLPRRSLMGSPPTAGRIVSLASRAMPSCSVRPRPRSRRHGGSIAAGSHWPMPIARRRLYDECVSAARSWTQPWRVVLKAEVMQADDNPRVVVTSLEAPTPPMLYEDLYCARGNGENAIKAVKNDLHSDRTSSATFLANAMRLLLACAASILILPWPRRNPRPSSFVSSQSLCRSNSTRIDFSSTCPVPVRSKRSYSG